MMNAQDELAALAEAIRRGSLGTSEIADAILAAGYSKPRAVSTVEELDALPEASVILASNADGDLLVSFKDFGGVWEQAGTSDGWQAEGIIANYPSASVLYEPRP